MRALFALLVCSEATQAAYTATLDTTYTIAVLTKETMNRTLAQYAPTFTTYLNEAVGEALNSTFETVSLDATDIFIASLYGITSWDFSFLDPAVATCQQSLRGGKAIATCRRYENGTEYSEMGAVLFVESSRSELLLKEDVRDRIISTTFLTVESLSIFADLVDRGLDAMQSPTQIIFNLEPAGVVADVLVDKVADFGVASSGLLESLVKQGSISASDYRIIEPMDVGSSFPWISSTALSPGWALTAEASVPEDVVKAVVAALGEMNMTHPAAIAASYSTWDTPSDYVSETYLLQDYNFLGDDNKCVAYDPVTLSSAVPCPDGYARLNADRRTSACADAGLSCPAGKLACACRPCLAVADYRISAHALSHAPGTSGFSSSDSPSFAGVECSKMETCLTVPQLENATFTVRDEWAPLLSALSLTSAKNVELLTTSNEATKCFFPPGVEFDCSLSTRYGGNNNATQAAYDAVGYAGTDPAEFGFTFSTAATGLLLIQIYMNGEEADESPLLMQVSERDCSAEGANRIADPQTGECVCMDSYHEHWLSGSANCYPGLETAGIVGICVGALAFLAIAAVFVLAYRRQRADAVWKIPASALVFPSPPVVLGRGTFGEVVKAAFRGSEVAVKKMHSGGALSGATSPTATATSPRSPTALLPGEPAAAAAAASASWSPTRRRFSPSASGKGRGGGPQEEQQPQQEQQEQQQRQQWRLAAAAQDGSTAWPADDVEAAAAAAAAAVAGLDGISEESGLASEAETAIGVASPTTLPISEASRPPRGPADKGDAGDVSLSPVPTVSPSPTERDRLRATDMAFGSSRHNNGSQGPSRRSSAIIGARRGRVSWLAGNGGSGDSALPSSALGTVSTATGNLKGGDVRQGSYKRPSSSGTASAVMRNGGLHQLGSIGKRGETGAASGANATLGAGTASSRGNRRGLFGAAALWRRCAGHSSGSSGARDFLAEVKVLSQLRHPNITTIMGVVLDVRPHLMVMECMEHGSLYDVKHNISVSLEMDFVVSILRDVACGMTFLHESGFLHNDIKAHNVLLDRSFNAKVADLGLASFVPKAGATTRNSRAYMLGGGQRSRAAGTPFWMAPCLLRGAPPSIYSDMYAFGITIFECLSRQEPYEEYDDPYEVLRRVADPTKVDPDVFRPTIPPNAPTNLVQLMTEAWSADLTIRPTFREMLQRLGRLESLHVSSTLGAADSDATHGAKARQRNAQRRRSAADPLDVAVAVQDGDAAGAGEDYEISGLPRRWADAVRSGRQMEQEAFASVCCVFTDIVGYSALSSKMTGEETVDMLDRLYAEFDIALKRQHMYNVDIIGDAYMAVSGLLNEPPQVQVQRVATWCVDAIRAANRLQVCLRLPELGYINIRAGLHAGPCAAGVVGKLRPRFSLFGDTINVAARMESLSRENCVQLSDAAACIMLSPEVNTDDGAGSFYTKEVAALVSGLRPRGEIAVKGKGTMKTWFLTFEGGQDPFLLCDHDLGGK